MPRYGKRIIGTIAYLGGLPANLEAFTWAWGQLIQYNYEYLCEPGEMIHYDRSTFSYHAAARNGLAESFYGDWLLMLDMDHTFEPDVAMRLLTQMNRHKIDVLTAIYQYKTSPFMPTIYTETGLGFSPIAKWELNGASIMQVDSCGAGTLMVRRSVFNRVKEELNENPFDPIDHLGEDHSFFKRLGKLGIKAYCAPMIESHHLRIQPLAMDDFKQDELRYGQMRTVGGFA